jgi:hypothetical protein
MAQHFRGKFWNFNYYMDKITFYEELPEVKIISKVLLHEQVFFKFLDSIFLYVL